MPGLTVVHSSGVPGDPSRLRLRGVSSPTLNNDPIIIVNGVRVYSNQSDPRNNNLAPAQTGGAGVGGYAAPSPLDQIDPNSIETIEVFKGPSASALYGSDAANGVIVITTKRGRAGPAHWNMALGDGANWLPEQLALRTRSSLETYLSMVVSCSVENNNAHGTNRTVWLTVLGRSKR